MISESGGSARIGRLFSAPVGPASTPQGRSHYRKQRTRLFRRCRKLVTATSIKVAWQLVPAGRPPPSGLLLFPNFKVAFRKTVSRAMMR
jgi:hypothetical protein